MYLPAAGQKRPRTVRLVRRSRGRERVTVQGLEPGGCDTFDHAEVEPRGGPARAIRLFTVTPVGNRRCREATPAVIELATGATWFRESVGWDGTGELLTPRPELRPVGTVRVERAVLQPDRRTIVAHFVHGLCDAFVGARAELGGDEAVVRLDFASTVAPGTACPAIGLAGAAIARLPAPAPPGVRIVGPGP